MCDVSTMIWCTPPYRKSNGTKADVLLSINKNGDNSKVLRISFSESAINRIRQNGEERIRVGYHPTFRNRLYFQPINETTGYKLQEYSGKTKRTIAVIPLKSIQGLDLSQIITRRSAYQLEKDKDNMAFIAIN